MSTPARDGLTVLPNAFQRLMLQWEQLAPYNAGQYATLTAELDEVHAQSAWGDVVITLGLQQIGQSPDPLVEIVDATIESHITRELNRPFVNDDSPLRPFVIRDRRGTHVGIIYRHVVADSASIRMLIHAWIERLLLLPSSSSARHIGLLRDSPFRPFDERRKWNVLRETVAEFSRASRAKRARRLPSSADSTATVEWRRVELPHGLVGRLVAYARREHVRVNDLFVAAAALACDELMPHEESDIRLDLGIGTIADVRPADRPPEQHFGLMLGFLQTFWRWQDLRNWKRTLYIAAAQSRVARECALADASIIRLFAALRVGETDDAEKLANFYRKRCPLAAGISNVNLNRSWPAPLHPSPLEAYTRVSPLGPMLPLVFTPTTLGDTLHLGVTYRMSVLSREAADAIIGAFIDRLDRETIDRA